MPFSPSVRRLLAAMLAVGCMMGAAPNLQAQMADGPDNPKLVPPGPLNERDLKLPGDPDRPVDLVVTLYTPPGPGPFPLAVINHAAAHGTTPADTPRHRYSYLAYYFMSRGYAVALPMMRGYAGSGGTQVNNKCDFGELALQNGRDIGGVITALASFAQIDTTRVVIAGEGFGGWNTLGAAALNPAGVHGVIDFFGGVSSSGCRADQGGGVAGLEAGARRLGAATTIPSLWVYGANDALLPPDVWRTMFKAYTREGGQAELADLGAAMSAAQLSRIESLPAWVSRLDAFLAKIELPSRETLPAYMPLAWPRRTHFAALDNVDAVPWVSSGGRDLYRKFLTAPWPRVFLIAPGGQSAISTGFFDPLAAGLAGCRQNHITCTPYAVDNDVVWSGGGAAPLPAASQFAALDDIQAVPFLSSKGRQAYTNFLEQPLPRAFVVAPGGESVTAQGGADPQGRALAICRAHGLDCRPYAVNTRVVWVAGQVSPVAPRPPASHFAALADVGAVPWLTEKGRAAYAHFLTVPLPRAFVIARGGESVGSQGGYDPLARALAVCAKAGLVCRPYAVDDDVVWQPPG